MSENTQGTTPQFPVRRSASERMAEGTTTQQTRQVRAVGTTVGVHDVQAGVKAGVSVGDGESVRSTVGVGNATPGDRKSVGIRRIHMTIARLDPLAALKLGFLISVAIGLMIVVAMAFLWFVLDGMHVFSQIEGLLTNLNSDTLLEFVQYLQFGRWMSFAVIVAILDIVLLTALSAVGALVYNLVAALVGGMRMTVTDE